MTYGRVIAILKILMMKSLGNDYFTQYKKSFLYLLMIDKKINSLISINFFVQFHYLCTIQKDMTANQRSAFSLSFTSSLSIIYGIVFIVCLHHQSSFEWSQFNLSMMLDEWLRFWRIAFQNDFIRPLFKMIL